MLVMILLLISSYFLIRFAVNKISDITFKQELYTAAVSANETILNDSRDDFTYDQATGQFKSGNYIINKDSSSIDYVEKSCKCSLFFYYQDTCVYTTSSVQQELQSDTTKLSEPSIWKEVSTGKTVYRSTSINNGGTPYQFVYVPLLQPSDHSIIGMICARESATAISHIKRGVKTTSAIALTCIIVICFLIQLFLFSTITANLKKVHEQVNDIVEDIKNNQGDLTKRIQCKAKNEIGFLADAVNELIEQLQMIMQNVKSGSSKLSASVTETEHNVSTSSNNAANISSTMEELSANMEEVATALETISISSKNMTVSIQNINAQAEKGNTLTAEIQKRATSVFEDTNTAYSEVQQTSASIREALGNAIAESHNVSKINELTEDILDISNQTNLLALNASIEAARAGEAGKGFSVVAEEIRELADNSRETANKIQKVNEMVITAVDQLANNSNEMLQFVSEKILSDYDIFKHTISQYQDDAMAMNQIITEFASNTSKIDENAQSMSGHISEISQSVEQSAIGIETVVGSINHLAEALVQVHGNTEGISKVSAAMEEYIVRFKKV